MPAVGHLDRVRRALARAVGVSSGPVTADHLRARVRGQPRLQRGGLAVGQQLDRLPGGQVHQHGAVDPPFPEGEIIHAGHLRRSADLRFGQGSDQAQQRGPAHRDTQRRGQPGTGPACQRQPDLSQ
jgi:hypothetical protein